MIEKVCRVMFQCCFELCGCAELKDLEEDEKEEPQGSIKKILYASFSLVLRRKRKGF